jgi:hypothetical protein
VAFQLEAVSSQAGALKRMAKLVTDGLSNPKTGPALIRAARKIVSDCDARDDQCEVEAIFEAVKYGTDKIRGLENGLRYVSDPGTFDYYSSAAQSLSACVKGSCAGDCDDGSILIVTLLVAIGFEAGLRAWGPKPGVKVYEHVYPVVRIPKHPIGGGYPENYGGHGLDWSVVDSYVGWEPRRGEVLTVWVGGA